MNKKLAIWLQSENPDNFEEIYKILHPIIFTLLKYNDLFRINKFSEEDAQEWTNDVIMILKKHLSRIEITGFFKYARMVIRNYLINRINERRDDDGKIINFVELQDAHISDSDKIVEYLNPQTKRFSNLIKYLNSEPENQTFQYLLKLIHWKFNKEKNKQDNFNNIIPISDLSRIRFTILESSNYNVIINPDSLIAKYDLWLNHNLTDREYMWNAIDNMILSIKEDREVSKPDPMVGAVLVDENGYVIASSYRGKNDPKGHCEYNLLEFEIEPKYILRKYQIQPGLPGAGSMVTELNLKNAVLFVTLEPCADRNKSKCSCADRVIYSGIKTVYVGLKDPNKDVDGKGIKKMEDAGITVKYFHQDLLFEIIRAKNNNGEQQNLEFILFNKEYYLKEQPELFINNILQL